MASLLAGCASNVYLDHRSAPVQVTFSESELVRVPCKIELVGQYDCVGRKRSWLAQEGLDPNPVTYHYNVGSMVEQAFHDATYAAFLPPNKLVPYWFVLQVYTLHSELAISGSTADYTLSLAVTLVNDQGKQLYKRQLSASGSSPFDGETVPDAVVVAVTNLAAKSVTEIATSGEVHTAVEDWFARYSSSPR
jgi:hypothetical protein